MRSRRDFVKLGIAGTILGTSPTTVEAASFLFSVLGPEKKFLLACAQGNTEKVRHLLLKNPHLLSVADPNGRSGFVLALLAGHRITADFLKEEGYQTDLHEAALDLDWERFEALAAEKNAATISRVNADHAIGGNAMWAAAAGGAGTDMWRVYSKCGDPNATPRGAAGSTALQKALRYPELNIAELTAATLLANAANPDPASNADLPPLHLAAQRGSLELTDMLIRLGADPTRSDQDGKTAAQLAEKAGHQATWELLQQHDRISRTCRTSRSAYTADGQTYQLPDLEPIPLFDRSQLVGLSHFNLEEVKKSLANDPRLAHSTATTSEKGIEASAHMGRKDLVNLFLDHGAPYALPTAVMLNDVTTVKRLLQEDPNRIHERGAHDFPLLWYPIIGNCPLGMMQLLLDSGARIAEQHYLGTTALHWACRRDSIELVELLVEKGADVNRVGRKFNAAGQRPLELTKDEKIIAFLRSRGAQ